MAEKINNPGWIALLTRLGISRFGSFFLSEHVIPVALVDASSVTLLANALTPLFGTPASVGDVVAPAAGTRLADTGQLAAGNWSIMVMVAHDNANACAYRLRRRNAADAADVWSQRLNVTLNTAGNNPMIITGRFSVAALERFVLEIIPNGLGTHQASIFATPG